MGIRSAHLFIEMNTIDIMIEDMKNLRGVGLGAGDAVGVPSPAESGMKEREGDIYPVLVQEESGKPSRGARVVLAVGVDLEEERRQAHGGLEVELQGVFRRLPQCKFLLWSLCRRRLH